MYDQRIRKWADVLVRYSLSLQPGQTFAINSTTSGIPLVNEVYRAALKAGAYPHIILTSPDAQEIAAKEGSSEQLTYTNKIDELVANTFDATLTIQASDNPKVLTNVDSTRIAQLQQGRRPIRSRIMERGGNGSMKWSLTLFPTNGFAQDADMSLQEFTDFVFSACLLDEPDPIASWKAVAAEQQRLVDWLKGKKSVHIKGSDTDISLSIEDRIFLNADGTCNFPDGEFFTGPVEDSVNGYITFDIPTSVSGRSVKNVRLRFENGSVVEAHAEEGQDYLDKMLGLDDGAKRLGEFAFGNNYNIKRGIRNILFDEKIGGTVHMALGESYPETGGKNKSNIHWDMICDLRKGGEVWVDGQLFTKDGKFQV